jgi:aryl-alcohol dehydrogenase-like predicted oxidoreductase
VFALQRGSSLLDMSWIASRPLVASVITGTTKAQQVKANVKAAAFKVSPEDLGALDALTVS